MRNVSDRSCTENQNTHFVFSDFFFENRTVYEIMWKNIVERGRPQMTVWRMRNPCWIPKATNTNSDYVALPQKWQHENYLVLFKSNLAVLMELYCRVKAVLPGVKTVPMQLRSPQILHGMISDQIWASAVRNRQRRA